MAQRWEGSIEQRIFSCFRTGTPIQKIGIEAIFQHFGPCSGRPEQWEARSYAIRLFLDALNQRAGKPTLKSLFISRRFDPEEISSLAAPAVEAALEAVDGHHRARAGDKDATIAFLATRDSDGYVYFIQAREGGPIKIGTAISVDARLAEIQRMSPAPLCVLATQSGGRSLEGVLHHRFALHRTHGEWFKPAPAGQLALIGEAP